MKIIFLLFFIFLSAACNQFKAEKQDIISTDLTSQSLETCTYIRNSLGQIVSWKDAKPVIFYFSKSVPATWKEVISKAADVWISESGQKLIHIQSDILESSTSSNDRKNVIYWMDGGALLKYQQAQTTTRWTKNKLQDADILINAKDFVFFNEEPEERAQIHLRSLLIHEFGHALGLKHVDKDFSVMYPELGFSQIRDMLTAPDLNSLKCEYK